MKRSNNIKAKKAILPGNVVKIGGKALEVEERINCHHSFVEWRAKGETIWRKTFVDDIVELV